MKKSVSVLIAIVIMLSLAGCGSSWDKIFIVSVGEEIKTDHVLEGRYYSITNTTNNTYDISLIVEFNVVEDYKGNDYTDEIKFGTIGPNETIEKFISHEDLVTNAGHEWSYTRSITTRPIVIEVKYKKKN